MLPKFLLHMFGVSLVLVAKRKEFVRKKISGADLASGLITLEFELGINDFARQDFYAPQLIMWTGGLYEFGVRRIEVEPVSLTEKPSIEKRVL
jgi:hypothetical protein